MRDLFTNVRIRCEALLAEQVEHITRQNEHITRQNEDITQQNEGLSSHNLKKKFH